LVNENRQESNTKTQRTIEKKKRKTENKSKKKKTESFCCNNFWILHNLTQFDHVSSFQNGPQQLWRLFSMSEDPGDRDLLVKISDDPHEYTKTAV
jgi:alkaline phosphatase